MPVKTTLYHIDHGAAELDSYDARRVLQEHPAEWRAEPWPKDGKPSLPAGAITSELKGPFEARDKGKGWWAIYDADGAEVGKSIREPDAVAFNEMSDDEKAEYAKAHAAES
ncbi:hypothetical protein [Gellertiella hungarica]|uniref:Uncharacterized protein n=1 Tax=Gellertiella hungarica TaxID=1572859 RepID=A0A7W6NLQ4_9HYPH|nr:hypothetical protein [Gellertiella hungarica]MBB4066755.1 hypothetical protein [Gellertiella hungarica]